MILFSNLTHCKKNSTSRRPKHVKFPDVFGFRRSAFGVRRSAFGVQTVLILKVPVEEEPSEELPHKLRPLTKR